MAKPICLLDTYIPTQCGLKFGFEDPVFHLPMDDNYANPKVYGVRQLFDQTFVDATGDPNTNAHSVAGHVGNALSFDGVDDHIIVTDESNQPYLDADTDFTFAIWIKANSPSAALNLRCLSNGEGNLSSFGINERFGQWMIRTNFRVGGVNYPVYKIYAVGIDANWHHFAIVREGYTIRLYMDGNLDVTQTNAVYATAMYTAGNSLYLGCQSGGGAYAPCDLDDLRLYTRALTTAEIAVLAT